MSIIRRLLLRASRSAWLAEQVRRRGIARGAVRRFMPGETLDDALLACGELARQRLGSVLTNLGERVTSRADAAAVRDRYLDVLTRVRALGLPSQISIKLTHLGLDGDPEQCTRDVRALADAAAESRSFLWIDMEESQYTDRTLALYRGVLRTHDGVGVCLQAYLHRTPDDLESLLPLSPAIRLVKGAYSEPAALATVRRDDTDARFEALARRLLAEAAAGRVRPVFGTHDTRLIGAVRADAAGLGLPLDAYEFHLLYGIRAADQRALASAGHQVRVLVSYGTAWFPWFMRRLAERPANVWLLVRR